MLNVYLIFYIWNMYFLSQFKSQFHATLVNYNWHNESWGEVVTPTQELSFDEQMQAMLSDGRIDGADQEAVLSLAGMLNAEQNEVTLERREFMSDVTIDILRAWYTVSDDRDLWVLATMLWMADIDVWVLWEIPDDLRNNMIFKKPRGWNNRTFSVHDSETGVLRGILQNGRYYNQTADARANDILGDNNMIDADVISNFNNVFDIWDEPVSEPLIGSWGSDIIEAPAEVVEAPAEVVEAHWIERITKSYQFY